MGFTLKAVWLAALVAATYPLAVAAHVGLDALFGDSVWLAELEYGSGRAAAFALVEGWIGSIPWVLGFWAIAILLRGASGPQRRTELLTLLLIGAALVGTILWFSIPVPLLLVLLLISAATLESCRARMVTR